LEQSNPPAAKQAANPLLKFALDMGPLLVFFATYTFVKGGNPEDDVTRIIYATAALMIVTPISLIASRILLKRIPTMPLVTGVLVLIFGGLTIYLRDPTFIYIKPTILYLLFACALAGGLLFRRLLLKNLLSEALQMRDEGWRLLTFRWIGFFLFLALTNEIVWRNFPEHWATFKTFGAMPMTFLFMMAQLSLIAKYQIPEVPSDRPEITSA